METQTRVFGKTSTQTDEFFRIVQNGDPVQGLRYEIALESGQVVSGRADGDGRTTLARDQLTQRAKLNLFPDEEGEG
jgi:uncharacterized protein (DUF2345 family)